MKTQIVHYDHNTDLPASVRGAVPDDTLQTIFRQSLNNQLSQGSTEMSAYIRAYRALETAGASKVQGKWIQKDGPTVGDVHVPVPMGGRKQKEKDDPDEDTPDLEDFPDLADGTLEKTITRPLAEGQGLAAAEIRKIAAHFARPEALTEPAICRDAWGGVLAAKWAARVIKKLDADPGADPALFLPPIEVNKAATAALALIAALAVVADAKKLASRKFEREGLIAKLDPVEHLVFGWASIVTIDGRQVLDTQGDQIDTATIENAGYEFCLTSRVGGEMHERADGVPVKVGQLVESFVVTQQKTSSMVSSLQEQGIKATMDMPFTGWWVGFKILDDAVWQRVVSGELKAFSIGGNGKRAKVAA